MFRLPGKKAISPELKCKINLIEPNDQIEVSYTINTTGQDILNQIDKQIELVDKDYYGLRFCDQIDWLDLTKSVHKQTKSIQDVRFDLRFKYYPAEPALLSNESTRYRLYSQLRIDLLEDRLRAEDQSALAYLIACILQCELGDYSQNDKSMTDEKNYVSAYKFVPNQSEELEWAAIKLHQSEDFLGLGPADAELNFLKKAHQLDTYGIDPYPVKDGNSQVHFLIGVNHLGISTFQDTKKTNQFTWDEVERITMDNKLVLIYCKKTKQKDQSGRKSPGSGKTKQLFGFRCPTQNHAYNFWKSATEHRYFFTLEYTPNLPIITNTGGIFKRSHKLKYSGRVEKDILRDRSADAGFYKTVKRSQSLMVKSMGEGPRWQGFNHPSEVGQNILPGSCMNIANKTMPSSMNCLREQDENLESTNSTNLGDTAETDLTNGDPKHPSNTQCMDISGNHLLESNERAILAPARKRGSAASIASWSQSSSINNKVNQSSMRRKDGSKFYTCTDQPAHDFLKSSIFLVSILITFFLAILLVEESSRPNSVNLLLKRTNFDHISKLLRQYYYLPLKSAIINSSAQIISVLR